MKIPRVLLLWIVAVSFLPGAHAGASYEPATVSVTKTSHDSAIVTWLPGAQVADSYRVYGIDSIGNLRLLGEFYTSSPATGATSYVAEGNFTMYGVSGVLSGVESPTMMASGGVGDPCIDIEPPAVFVNLDCLM